MRDCSPTMFAAFGDLPGVTVHDVPAMSSDEIGAVLRQPGAIIGGFCNSGACLATQCERG